MRLIYYRDRPSQTRGFPWIHTALIRLNNISAYEEAEIYAARLGASKMGFITRDADENSIGTGEDDGGNQVISAEPGTFEYLNPGQDIKFFDPNHPSGNFDPFIKSQLRGAAAGLDVSYSALSSDYSDANYSSLRQGALYERDNWMTMQSWVIRWFFEPLYSEWLSMFLLSGLSNLPASKYDKFNSPMFFGRRWKWVDPVKDITAMKLELDLKIKTRTQICNENGYDFLDIVEELAAEEKLLREKGLLMPAPVPANTNSSTNGDGL
jgi:lambda family phage portal protein